MKTFRVRGDALGILLSFLVVWGVCEAQRQEKAPKPQQPGLSTPTAATTHTVEKPAARVTPMSDRLRAEVMQALAAWGSDAMLAAKLPNSDQYRGWITRREKGAWTVHFIGEDRGAAAELCAVDFAEFAPKAARLRAWTKTQPLNAELAAMYRALQQATKSPQFIRHTDNYNPVVLPGALIGQVGWLVYLLAATTDSREVIVGGHYCIRVSADGGKLLEARPLSKGFPILKKERDTVGLFVTHVISEAPIETHVFVSLLHGQSLFVITSAGVWRVADGTVTHTGMRVKSEGESAGKPQP